MAEVVSVNLHTNKKGPVICVLGFLFFLLLLFLFNFSDATKKFHKDRGNLFPNNSESSTSIRKCCGLKEVLRISNGTPHCVKSEFGEPTARFENSLKFYRKSRILHQLREIRRENLNITILHRCEHFGELEKEYLNTRKFLFDDGKVWDKYYNEVIDQSEYCVDTLEDEKEEMVISPCQDSPQDLQDYQHSRRHHRFIRNTIRAVSQVFYLVSFLVFAVQPSIRQGYGRWLMCYLAARLLSIIQVMNFFNLNLKYPSLCLFTGMVLQFSELSSQAWQIVTFYHIWLALRPDNHSPLCPTAPDDRRRFLFLSAVALGAPLAIVLLTALAQELFTDPAVVLKHCWYNNRAMKTFIIATPHVVTDLAVLGLCVDILRLIREYKKDAATLPPNNIRHYNAKEIQWSCIYVVVTMVVSINYLILSVLLFLDLYYKKVPNVLYYTVESIETMRGVDIFFIFVCHKSLLFLIRKTADNSFRFVRSRFQSFRQRDIPLQQLVHQDPCPLPRSGGTYVNGTATT